MYVINRVFMMHLPLFSLLICFEYPPCGVSSVSICHHVAIRVSKVHQQLPLINTNPLVVSQYFGKDVQDTRIQDEQEDKRNESPILRSESVSANVETQDLSSYMESVPKDKSKEAIMHIPDSLPGEKRWTDAHERKKSDEENISRQLLSATNTVENSQQASDNSDERNEQDIGIKEGMLAHNSFRLLHHVQPLQWNESLAEQAQRAARAIVSDPSSFQGESPGENIAQIWHDFPHAPLKASNIWYSERKDYSFAYPTVSNKVRHFIQMVWKDTTQVGLGTATNPSEKYKIVVALYWPIGNDFHPKELEANVLKPGGGPDVYATLKWDILRPTAIKTEA